MNGFENVRLEKSLYASGNFNDSLSVLDPDDNYRETSLDGLDAFQRQLKRFGIRVGGDESDCVEKFFSTAQSAVLFPEYVSRAVRQGMEQADILPDITAVVTKISGVDYRSLRSITSGDGKELKTVGEGAFIPETAIRTKENLVTLHKRGRTLVASYEAIKYQRLDLFTASLRQIGAYISNTLLRDAVDVLINGDGNSNAAPVIHTAQAGTLTYEDLVNFWNSFDPCEMNTIIASPDMMAKILNMAEFRDAAAGLTFHGTGKVITPFGAKLIRSASVPAGRIVGFDSRSALEMVKSGEMMTEYDKLIDRQLERAVISCTAGFAKIYDESAKVLAV